VKRREGRATGRRGEGAKKRREDDRTIDREEKRRKGEKEKR